ncbi:MAG: PLP-dependent aminotransferase family protein [Methylococcaceae bacterium]|nr:PLP-dependent aminotransferase family protein [Methylococcaceae bacterium]
MTDPIFELAIDLPPQGSGKLLRVLHLQLRSAIVNGRLHPGTRLPATRQLAASIGISRNTAVALYDLLQSQGYIDIRPGAGAFVARYASQPPPPADSQADSRLNPFWRNPPSLSPPFQPPYRFDFRIGLSDTSNFPFQIWQRLLLRSQRTLAKMPSHYADPQGQASLREAIAGHVSFARAVACQTEDILVTTGIQQALDLLARILVTPGQTTLAMEEPGYQPAKIAFIAAGAKVIDIPVDNEGICVAQIPSQADVVYVTPTHQFPLGHTLSMSRRTALLEFARQHRAVIIEDDYDSEFRYGSYPLDALQTLDRNGLVFYLGTFSKCLFPTLRLGFVVMPAWSRQALIAAKRFSDWHSPALEQETLASYIAEGHLARHIRRMRKVYGERHAALISSITHHCDDLLEPISAACGLHLTALLKDNRLQAEDIAERAADIGIGLYALTRYPIAESGLNGFAFGLGMIDREDVDEAIARLAETMRDERS